MQTVGLRAARDLHASATIKWRVKKVNNLDVLVELRAWRDEFARSHAYDLASIAKALRELDAASNERIVRGEPRRPITLPQSNGAYNSNAESTKV